MGFSTKQVSGEGLDWSQTLLQAQTMAPPKPAPLRRQQSQPPEKCPRCGSNNTKFCYYNNYNKSQPRHFCKTCKRHWTKGGTLRNVPIGGGRKNKRLKPSKATSSSKRSAAASASTPNPHPAIQDDKGISGILDQPLLLPPSSQLHHNSNIYGSALPAFPNQNPFFSFSTSNSLDCTLSPNPCAVAEESSTTDDPTVKSFVPVTSGNFTPPWQLPLTSDGMDMTSCWTWEDFDKLISSDLNLAWDGSEIKP